MWRGLPRLVNDVTLGNRIDVDRRAGSEGHRCVLVYLPGGSSRRLHSLAQFNLRRYAVHAIGLLPQAADELNGRIYRSVGCRSPVIVQPEQFEEFG